MKQIYMCCLAIYFCFFLWNTILLMSSCNLLSLLCSMPWNKHTTIHSSSLLPINICIIYNNFIPTNSLAIVIFVHVYKYFLWLFYQHKYSQFKSKQFQIYGVKNHCFQNQWFLLVYILTCSVHIFNSQQFRCYYIILIIIF